MRNAVKALMLWCAAAVLPGWLPIAASADGTESQEVAEQVGEHLWVASFAITPGATIQYQHGSVVSNLYKNGSAVPVSLGVPISDEDLSVAPFVGGSLELMTPALAVPTRPRFFLSAEYLPTFSTQRTLAVDGDPGCIRGPEPLAPCAKDEKPGQRTNSFGDNSANGAGSRVFSEIDQLVYGASLGAAFPFQLAERQLRIKPSLSWISYEVDVEGLVTHASCRPVGLISQCTNVYTLNWVPGQPPTSTGFLRETILQASDSQRFNGVGPGIDLEVDTGRFGPIGTSLFLGARAYRVLGDRTISFGTSATYNDELGNDVATANFEVEVDPWLYRGHVGIRLAWLGSRD